MGPGEALLGEVAPQVPYLLGDVDALVVEEQGDDVVGGVGLVGPENVPALGWTRAFRPAQNMSRLYHRTRVRSRLLCARK